VARAAGGAGPLSFSPWSSGPEILGDRRALNRLSMSFCEFSV
jgi:hypothetical protein